MLSVECQKVSKISGPPWGSAGTAGLEGTVHTSPNLLETCRLKSYDSKGVSSLPTIVKADVIKIMLLLSESV